MEIATGAAWDENGFRAFLDKAAAEIERRGLRNAGTAAAFVGKVGSLDGRVIWSNKIISGVPVTGILKEKLGAPALVLNDTYLSLMLEAKKRGLKNAVYVYVGVGISCAFIINGRVYTGGGDFAGELGMLKLTAGSEPLELKMINESYDKVMDGLISFLANVIVLFDLDVCLIAGPRKNFANRLLTDLTERMGVERFVRAKVESAAYKNTGEGLSAAALEFAHESELL
jgi:predicted NBD/HSP70 family sugar kinase